MKYDIHFCSFFIKLVGAGRYDHGFTLMCQKPRLWLHDMVN